MKPAIILHHNKLEIKQLPMWANRTSGRPVKNDFTNLCSNTSSGLRKERENDHIFWVSQIILCVSPANLLYFKIALFSHWNVAYSEVRCVLDAGVVVVLRDLLGHVRLFPDHVEGLIDAYFGFEHLYKKGIQ